MFGTSLSYFNNLGPVSLRLVFYFQSKTVVRHRDSYTGKTPPLYWNRFPAYWMHLQMLCRIWYQVGRHDLSHRPGLSNSYSNLFTSLVSSQACTSCSCLCPIHWSQVLSWEWRCSWSSADRRCSNYIWVTNNLIAYKGATYIRGLMVLICVCDDMNAAITFGWLPWICPERPTPTWWPHADALVPNWRQAVSNYHGYLVVTKVQYKHVA